MDLKEKCRESGGNFDDETNTCIIYDNKKAFEDIGKEIWNGELTGRVKLKTKDTVKEIGSDSENVWMISYTKRCCNGKTHGITHTF